MKKQLGKVGAFVPALLATSVALGQNHRGETVADIPFNFTVANRALPPGRYTVARVNQTLLRIFNSHNQGTLVLAHSAEGMAPEETGKMIVHRYGATYFLSEVWDPTSGSVRKLFQSRAEAEVARKQTPMEIAVLKIQYDSSGTRHH
jgi:hypothetical protein